MFWSFAGALLIGFCLGLMGSGGSIVTVPVLTWVLGQAEKVAIAGSLAIVGLISLVAAIPYARERLIDYRSGLLFGVPGMAGAYVGAGASRYVSGGTQILVFSAVVLLAAASMLRPGRAPAAGAGQPRPAPLVAALGLIVGVVTGFVGVGGGFLIVPALTFLGGLPMRRAVGTSLLIIATTSSTGFLKHRTVLAEFGLELDWRVIATFSALGITGSLLGKVMGDKIPQSGLRRAFAGFLLAIGAFILLTKFPGHHLVASRP